jgi:hypothetical protein
MSSGAYVVKALDEGTWDDFAGLVERNNGIFWRLLVHRLPPGRRKERVGA